ncbi:MAG TPA: hypothetical protein VMT20_15115 [Terriglobia bacterium]|nr:hypothetical protein [Terriglobia bacterium]
MVNKCFAWSAVFFVPKNPQPLHTITFGYASTEAEARSASEEGLFEQHPQAQILSTAIIEVLSEEGLLAKQQETLQ